MVPAGASVGEARAVAVSRPHTVYPVVRDDGSLEGLVTGAAVLLPGATDDSPVEDLVARDVPTIQPSASLVDALAAMHDEGVEQLPVVEDGRLVGLCTRTDLLRVRSAQLAHERPEPGWLARRRPSPNGSTLTPTPPGPARRSP
jgi:CBS domain-containing protein